MSVEIDIDLSGIDARFSERALESAQEEFTAKVLADCGDEVPVDTGTLKGSGHVSAPDEIEWSAEYAGYVYNGTSKMPGRPWFESAKEKRLGEWERFAAETLKGGAE